ncbi:MAG: PAS domain-containing protein [Kiloniellales bacterium]
MPGSRDSQFPWRKLAGLDPSGARAAPEEWLQALIESAPLGAFLLDRRGCYRFANGKFRDLLLGWGADPEGIEGRRPSDVLPSTVLEQVADLDRTAIEHKVPVQGAYRAKHVEEVRAYLRTVAPILSDEGELLGLCGYDDDISDEKLTVDELRENRNILRAVIDAVPVAINVKDRDGRMVLVNRMLSSVFDMSEQKLMERRTGWSQQIDDTIYQASSEVADALEVLRTGVGPRFADRLFERKDGRKEIWYGTRVPIEDSRGEVKYVLTVSIDVTEQRATEERLRQAQRMEAVGQLTGGIAHDFNNLLSIVSGNLELVQDAAGSNPEVDDFARRGLEACARGARLIQQILAFSRRQPLQPQPIDIRELVAGMAHLLERSLGTGIEVETLFDRDLWLCEVDPTQMESAILNLAINARDAMPNGGLLAFTASNARLDDDFAAANAMVTPGPYVLFSVRDSGVGIPRELQRRIFEPFFSTKGSGAGSGLGLSMVYGFVRQSRGHVEVDSEEGKGAVFRLYLPRAESTRRPAPARDVPPAVGAARGEAILVVEDEPEVRALTVSMLADLGYPARAVAEGAAALRMLESGSPFDLLLTDLMLPGGMSGRTVADEAIRLRPGLKIVFMSGYSDDEIVNDGRLSPGVILLRKPFLKADLARSLRQALDG